MLPKFYWCLLFLVLIGTTAPVKASEIYEMEIFSLNYRLNLTTTEYNQWLDSIRHNDNYLVIKLGKNYAYQHKIYHRSSDGLLLVAAARVQGDSVAIVSAINHFEARTFESCACKDYCKQPIVKKVDLSEMAMIRLLFDYLTDDKFFSVSGVVADKEVTQIFRIRPGAKAYLEFVLESDTGNNNQTIVAKFFRP